MKEKLKQELKSLNAQMDEIVGQGGRILLTDPLLVKSKSIKLKLKKYV